MRHKFLAVLFPFAAGLLGGMAGPSLVVQAQRLEATLMAESVTAQFMRVVGANSDAAGSDRIQLATQWNGAGPNVRLLGPDGQTRRVVISAGGIEVPDPDGSGMNVYNQNGVVVGRFGQGRGPLGNQPLRNLLFLSDQNGKQRILLAVDSSGNPTIKLMDAFGNIIWSAP
jgi:hypothetical protein